jgi:hypothetical protein
VTQAHETRTLTSPNDTETRTLAAAQVVRGPGPRWFRLGLGAVAGVYLMTIILGSAGSSFPGDVLPRSLRYLTQIACLFPRAATHTIEYHAVAYSCRDQRFRELDHRRYFPIHPDDKENRFERLVYFYRRNTRVMEALDEHLVERHNALVARGEDPGDGIEGPIGGILVMSLRIPLPEGSSAVERYQRKPASEQPREWRKRWYRTPRDRRVERCAGAMP